MPSELLPWRRARKTESTPPEKPAIAVLDDATSALDEASQAALLRLLRSELPLTTVISVAQRPETEAFHDRCLRLVRGDAGARLIGAEPAATRASA